jgi:hypothetical protein
MVIRFPEREPVELEGRLVWSNLEAVDSKSALPGMGFSFVKFSNEDRQRIESAG